MTRGTGQRLYRACTRCRARKAKCDLKCAKEGVECIAAASRRGGDYSQFRRGQKTGRISIGQCSGPSLDKEPSDTTEPGCSGVHGSLRHPSDALLILANAARDNASPALAPEDTASTDTASAQIPDNHPAGLGSYPPLRGDMLTPELIDHLLRHYAQNYHSLYPVVPLSILQPSYLANTIKQDCFLLKAILVIASRDRTDLAQLHASLWEYMQKLILDVVLGLAHIRTVGCVEGLLLLGEWIPAPLGHDGNSDGGEGTAWSIVGLGVRLAYLLRLEDSSFKDEQHLDALTQRKRLAGPPLSTRFTADDFPSLRPKHSYEDGLASLLQAQIELTTLFGNAHDILFASKQRTKEAVAAWKDSLNKLNTARHLKCCLMIMEHYLLLYVNAFAFQAVLYRYSATPGTRARSCFPASTMASPDAQRIYAAVDAANKILRITAEEIDPEKHLRYLPARFYLYTIHSAVFLFKAHTSGAISPTNASQTITLARRFISTLVTAASDSSHIAARYARLLQRLQFQKVDTGNNPTKNSITLTLDFGNNADDMSLNSLPALGTGGNNYQLPLFDSTSLLHFDYADKTDDLFTMPPSFQWPNPYFFYPNGSGRTL
ncbi:hypothetical protein F5Y03DRAFT_388940 [Xylaria venustula]|nr:hypothetical protein F5Y03DRAFT_388940 [Xylaria venustula]